MYQKSLIILKPDAIQRKISGKIIERFENIGLKIHAVKLQMASKELLRKHYSEHTEKKFYPSIEKYMYSGPCLFFVLGGLQAIKKIRLLIGGTEPHSSLPGTIRGDYAHQPYDSNEDIPLRNLIHASSSEEEALKEISIWFDNTELIDYNAIDDKLLIF